MLLNHLKCAVFELPMRAGERFGPHDPTELCAFLAESGLLHRSGNAWHWTSDTYPADTVSLRSVSSDNFVVVDTTDETKIIGEVSFTAALTTLHEKAIYLHEAKQFHVERFDYKERKAYVKAVDCDYYTDAIDYTQVKRCANSKARPVVENVQKVHGDVRVNRQIVGFKKIKFYTGENVGAGQLSMPEQEMHTTSFWLHFSAAFLAGFARVHADRAAERAERTRQCLPHCGVVAADVRSARSGRRAHRRYCRESGGLGAESVSVRQLFGRRGHERAALSDERAGC